MLKKLTAAPRAKIVQGDELIAEVRGISPSDLTGILMDVGEDLGGMFDFVDEIDKMKTAKVDDPSALADQLMSDWPKIVQAIGTHMPNLLSKIIARAADEPDEWEMVRDTYGFALQFEILVEIARLTFTSPEAFTRFVGNVLALVDLSGTLTSGNTRRPRIKHAQPSLAGGSTTSSP